MFRIIGIDPGTKYMGIGILDMDIVSLKIIKITPLYMDMSRMKPTTNRTLATTKMTHITKTFMDIFNTYNPDRISIESAYMQSLQPTAYGALIRTTQAIERATIGLPSRVNIKYYSPSSVKKSIKAKGGDKKAQVLEMIQTIPELDYPYENLTPDEIDAIMIAYKDLLYLRNNSVELLVQ